MKTDLVKALGVSSFKGCLIVNDGSPFARSLNLNGEFVSVDDLRAALEKLPVVYGSKEVKSNAWCWFDKMSQGGSDTHTARLFAIEEIKREEVKLYEYLVYSPKNNCMRSAKPRWFKSDEEFRKSFDKTYPIIKTGREITVEEIEG